MKELTLDELKERIQQAEKAEHLVSSIFLLSEYVTRTEDDGYYRYLLGENLRAIGDPMSAQAEFAKVLRIPVEKQYLFDLSLAQLHADVQQLAEAEHYFRTAVSAAPAITDARVCYSGFLAQAGRTRDAIEILLPARELAGDQSEVSTLLGNYSRALAEYANATEYYKKALEYHSGHYAAAKALSDLEAAMLLKTF